MTVCRDCLGIGLLAAASAAGCSPSATHIVTVQEAPKLAGRIRAEHPRRIADVHGNDVLVADDFELRVFSSPYEYEAFDSPIRVTIDGEELRVGEEDESESVFQKERVSHLEVVLGGDTGRNVTIVVLTILVGVPLVAGGIWLGSSRVGGGVR